MSQKMTLDWAREIVPGEPEWVAEIVAREVGRRDERIAELRQQLASRDERDADRVKKLGKARGDRERLLEALHAVALGDADRLAVQDFLADWRRRTVPLHAIHGGCWFCHRSDADSFCKGWDAGYHRSCLELERVERPDNPELTEFP